MMDAGPDDNLYLDQVERPLEVLRFPLSGGTPAIVADSENYQEEYMQPVEFSDGRLLLPGLVSGRARLLISKPGGNFVPMVDNAEETGPPAALLPNDEVAFIIGTGLKQTIAIASARDDRIVRRLEGVKGEHVVSMAASPDGKTIYYAASGSVWAIPATDGTPRKICTGDGIAVDPHGKDLIVSLSDKAGTHLVWISLSGSPGHDVRVQKDLPISPQPLGGNSVRRDGKLLVEVAPKDSWFYSLAMLDPTTGALTTIPVNYTGDIMGSGWASDGRVLAIGFRMRAHIWRFRLMR
jgi:hypothetical protein